MNNKALKVMGIVTTIVGVGLSLVTKYVEDKTLDHKIGEEVAKALSEKATKIES